MRTDKTHECILGNCIKMREVDKLLWTVAGKKINVLIWGEKGTGKETIAREIYARSIRRDKPFLKVDCSVLEDNSADSELFGTEPGSYSHLFPNRPGKLQFSNRGTIFLDEVSDLSVTTQDKLYQFLKHGRFGSEDSPENIKVDIQMLASTTENKKTAFTTGKLSIQFMQKMNVLNIYLPPLRDRKDDIPLFVDRFMRKYELQYNKKCKKPSRGTMDAMIRFDWPGNLTELEDLVDRFVHDEKEDHILDHCSIQPMCNAPMLES